MAAQIGNTAAFGGPSVPLGEGVAEIDEISGLLVVCGVWEVILLHGEARQGLDEWHAEAVGGGSEGGCGVQAAFEEVDNDLHTRGIRKGD